MRNQLTLVGAAALSLLVPATAHAVNPMDSDVNQSGSTTTLTSKYKEQSSGGGDGRGSSSSSGGTSTKTTTTTTRTKTVPEPDSGADAGQSSSSGSSGSGDTAPSRPPTAEEKAVGTYWGVECQAQEKAIAAGMPVPSQLDCSGDSSAPDAPQGPQTKQVTVSDTQTHTTTKKKAKPKVTREQVRKKAVDQIQLAPPEIGASPCLAAPGDCTGTVGVPVWLWVEDGGQLPTDTAEAEAGPWSVKAKAKVTEVRWSLGDGQSTVCHGAGTVFNADAHGWSTPDCGFKTGWKKAGTYTLTATYQWQVSWSGDVNGSTTQQMSSSQDVTVREIQAVVDGHQG